MQQTRVQRAVRPRRRETAQPDTTPPRTPSDTTAAAALLRRIDSLVSRG